MNVQKKFEIGFWHPFGTHAGETAEDIVKRKLDEIRINGWTLWSFKFRKTLGLWYQEIQKNTPNNVVVFCSQGKNARDPKGDTKYCNYYKPINETAYKKIPPQIKVPHPMGNKTNGSAFIINNIIFPASYKPLPVEWLRKNGKWENTPFLPRTEYLIKSGLSHPVRKFRAILELKYPYLAEVGVYNDSQ